MPFSESRETNRCFQTVSSRCETSPSTPHLCFFLSSRFTRKRTKYPTTPSISLTNSSTAKSIKVLIHNLYTLHHSVEGGESLLTIHNKQTRCSLLGACSNSAVFTRETVLPEKKSSDGIATVHRIKQIAYTGCIPNKRSLNIRKTYSPLSIFSSSPPTL